MNFYFGSWEKRLGTVVYMVSAKCDWVDSIHKQEYILSQWELETLRIDPFAILKAKMEYKFERFHQIAIHL